MHCSRNWKSRGLTLIEVIASIGLMSTLLVMLLSIHSRHVRQINLAFEKQTSIQLLDGLLADWFSDEEPFPANQSGYFSNQANYSWRTTVLPSTASNPLWKTRVIRVEILSQRTNAPLAFVDLIDSRKPGLLHQGG